MKKLTALLLWYGSRRVGYSKYSQYNPNNLEKYDTIMNKQTILEEKDVTNTE